MNVFSLPGNIIPNNNIVTTLYVGGSGSGNYSTIQNAIDNATASDTVFVYDDSSPYSENIVINKSLNLVGEDKNTTIIDGSGTGDVILISADKTNIKGFTIRNGGSSCSGISLADHSDYNVITANIIISNKWDGISLHHSSNNTISYNIFSDNSDGIYLSYFCNNNNILGNVLLDNTFYGIYIQSSNSDNVIYFNNLIGNGQNVHDESNNIWDDGWNGNYWDDYEERYPYTRKIWLKGIWSAPYDIPGGDNKDRYPLFKPYAKSDIKIKNINVEIFLERFSLPTQMFSPSLCLLNLLDFQ
jgi:parallel beta-helix repeat protein